MNFSPRSGAVGPLGDGASRSSQPPAGTGWPNLWAWPLTFDAENEVGGFLCLRGCLHDQLLSFFNCWSQP